jgi:hypothetical protein
LGVRRFSDPEQFYRHHVRLAGAQLSWSLEHPLLSPGEGLRRWVASAPDALVEHAVDALVVFAGGYGEAELVISEYLSSGRSFTSPWLAIYAATLASAEQPELALEYLDVARGLTDDIEEVFAIDLRSAAVAVKRRSDASGALNVLNELDAAIDMYPSSGTEPTAGDRSAMHAMVANLRALAHLNLAQPDQADASVREALTLAAADGLTGLTADRAFGIGSRSPAMRRVLPGFAGIAHSLRRCGGRTSSTRASMTSVLMARHCSGLLTALISLGTTPRARTLRTKPFW